MTGQAPYSEDDIYARIKQAIASQQLAPGTRLRENEVRALFSVTRSRIRKVFSRLAYDGLLVIEHNRGASVARPTSKEARDLFAARRAIEVAIGLEAMARLDAQSARQLYEHIEKEAAADKNGHRDDAIALSGAFHLILSEIAGNSVLTRYLKDIVSRESLIIQLYERPGQPNCAAHDHKRIVDAMVEGNQEKMIEQITLHINDIENRLDLNTKPKPEISLANILNP